LNRERFAERYRNMEMTPLSRLGARRRKMGKAKGGSFFPRPARSLAVLSLAALVSGCDSGLLDPQGPISEAERQILFNATAIMLVVVLPVIVLTLVVAWWYRSSNARAIRKPDWSYSGHIELVVWSIPAMVVILLGGVSWIGSHDLDPRKPIPAPLRALEVEVVSLDWKWLFIYPEQKIAAVNQLVIPAGTPVNFRLTSATVMNSFFVPQLGSQIYTMAGMTTRLSLLADKQGEYPGLSAQFSGDGFSDMHFIVRSVTPAAFEDWVAATRREGGPLDRAAYAELAQQARAVVPVAYGMVEPDLFQSIVDQTAPPPGRPHPGKSDPTSSPPSEN
jgi:cytochrome o ubiquinol oxidase subunit II